MVGAYSALFSTSSMHSATHELLMKHHPDQMRLHLDSEDPHLAVLSNVPHVVGAFEADAVDAALSHIVWISFLLKGGLRLW